MWFVSFNDRRIHASNTLFQYLVVEFGGFHPFCLFFDEVLFSRLTGVFSRVVYLQQSCNDDGDDDQGEDLVHVVLTGLANLYEKREGICYTWQLLASGPPIRAKIQSDQVLCCN